MAELKVPHKDLTAVFKRLKSVADNKMCFDCRASNPTWASVTYGVFLCIDCSAVHRSLGVHLSFIRSIQLDTSWTWSQLRAMQVGGNAKANAFFRQHNLSTSDSKAKYNSRVASMYREKIQSLTHKAMQQYGTDTLMFQHSHNAPTTPDAKEVDFFNEEHHTTPIIPTTTTTTSVSANAEENHHIDVGHLSSSPPKAAVKVETRVSTIGARKPGPSKKKGLGAKKGGLGATKVKTDFSEIETELQKNDKMREAISATTPAHQDNNDLPLSNSLQYQGSKAGNKMRESDPKKAEQMERLGMASGGSNRAFSHSASDCMNTVEQVTPINAKQSSFKERYSTEQSSSFFDSYTDDSTSRFTEQPPRYESGFDNSSTWGSTFESSKSKDRLDEPSRSRGKREQNESKPIPEESMRKFAGSKSISSDQYFGNSQDDDSSARLERFQGSTGISSADLYGDEKRGRGNSVDYQNLKAGVSQVTGKISSMASGVIGSLQSRYSGTPNNSYR